MWLGRDRDAQKSLFQPISRHSDFRVTDLPTFLPTYTASYSRPNTRLLETNKRQAFTKNKPGVNIKQLTDAVDQQEYSSLYTVAR